MDYLLRDAYFTGTKYGEFDLERILRTIRVRDHKMVVKESGMHSVEDYIMARYHMYWQVYFHPVSRSFESMLALIFARLKQLRAQQSLILEQIPIFNAFLEGRNVSVEDHFLMDESACNYGFTRLRQSADPIAADLARRLLDRDLFQSCEIHKQDQLEAMRARLVENGWDLTVDEVRQRPYQPYQGNENSMVWVLMEDGAIQELSAASVIAAALVHGESKNDLRMYYPREIERD